MAKTPIQLYLVPVPLGNLEDITLRAIRMLKESDFILAEDTRTTGKLLKHLAIQKPIYPFHAHNEHKVIERLVEKIQTAQQVVLVSDAGTPAISDPGFMLVRACIQAGVGVSCLPGPTAFVPALVGSGFPADRFVFEGFLPHKKGRQTKWERLKTEERTIILYESPHRLVKCLKEIKEHFGEDQRVCVAREISKLFETFHRGTAAELLLYFEEHPPKGEITLLIDTKEK